METKPNFISNYSSEKNQIVEKKNEKSIFTYLTFLVNLLAIIDKIIANPLNVNNKRNTAITRTPMIAATIRKNIRLIKPAPMPIPIKNLPSLSFSKPKIKIPPNMVVKPPAAARINKIKKAMNHNITIINGGGPLKIIKSNTATA